jgi:hypothetical protein
VCDPGHRAGPGRDAATRTCLCGGRP